MLAAMASRDSASSDITPEVLLRAYACGIFPMAESADDPSLFWVEPEMRGIIPLDGFRIATRLARTVRSDLFTVRVNTAFKAVMAGCATPQEGREDTWINKRIRDLYAGLHALGHCHSVEAWQGDELVGGLYGVSLGRAFFGESMFHRARDASKVALVHLVARLIAGGFELLDTQLGDVGIDLKFEKRVPEAEGEEEEDEATDYEDEEEFDEDEGDDEDEEEEEEEDGDE